MILVIYYEKIINQHFIDYLQNALEDVRLISFKSLRQMQIYDQTNQSTIWIDDACKIDFNDVTGIYNEIYYLSPENFKDYIDSDQEYVRSEWTAYLMYITQKYQQKVFNPFNHYILSGDIFHLPYIYKILGVKGIKVPKIILSMDMNEINEIFTKGDYIPLVNTTEKFSFTKRAQLPENCIGLVKYCEGDTIIAHVIEDKLFCCKVKNNKKVDYELPLILTQICIKFTQEIGLKLSEFIFREDGNNQLILYRFSIMPRFTNNSVENLERLYDLLITKLQNTT